MTGLAFLIPVALLMGLIGLVAFFWSLKSGQFEDLDGAAARILIDDEDDLPVVKKTGHGAAAKDAVGE